MDYYKPEVAQVLFDSAWQEAEGMLAIFISKHFPPGVILRIIPENERDPNCPRSSDSLGPSSSPHRFTSATRELKTASAISYVKEGHARAKVHHSPARNIRS